MDADLIKSLIQAAAKEQEQEDADPSLHTGHQQAEGAEEGQEETNLGEEYKTWKKHSPYLYDLVVTHALEWPSLTCQWLPDRLPALRPGVSEHHILLGTQTSDQDRDYLEIARVGLPVANAESGSADSGTETEDHAEGDRNTPNARVNIVQRIVHQGDVNRARYNPLRPSLIATHGVTGELYVFDRDAHPHEPETDEFRPDLILRGQKEEGYGLSWSERQDGLVLSASEDGTACLWDVAGGPSADAKTLDPLQTFRAHTGVVNDCVFDPHRATQFASVGDDSHLFLWDTRQPEEPAVRTAAGGGAEVNAVAWNSFSGGQVLATAGADKVIRLWDLRSLTHPVHALEHHTEPVLGLAFSPTEATMLASSAQDRRVNVWDLSRIGLEQEPGDAEDGPPELLFQHGGHTSTPSDVAWAPHDPWHLLTTAEDNVVQLWRPKRAITDEMLVHPRLLE